MARLLAATVTFGLLAGCSSGSATDAVVAPSELDLVVEPSWQAHLDDLGLTGTFALHRLGSDEVLVHDPDRAAQARLPASTFKILNSLIALDTGAVADVDTMIPWDGVRRSIPEWNQDHSLRTGIAVSAVWVYQHLAREVGRERMAERVAAAGYGNAEIGGAIDEFWLNGDLRISPLEQLDFLVRLMSNDLPFDPAHQAAVRDILVREQGEGWSWGHKTGTALSATPVLGWLVGFTVHDGETWVFALNIDLGDEVEGPGQTQPQVRQQLARRILVAAGALPAT